MIAVSLLSALASGAFVYIFTAQPNTLSALLTNSNASKRSQYGSNADFDRAIEELRAAFASDEDAVSTAPEDLQDHGFSVNDYHPGTPNAFTSCQV